MTNNIIPFTEGTGPVAVERVASREITLEASKHFHLGMEQLGYGEPEQALVAFEHAIERVPDFPDAHIGMGIAHALCSNIYPAIDHLQAAAELEPDNYYAHFKLSQLYFKLRIPDKGYEEARAALKCATQVTERQFVSQLLREERAREHNGIVRPLLNRPFGTPAAVVGVLALAAAITAVLTHLY